MTPPPYFPHIFHSGNGNIFYNPSQVDYGVLYAIDSRHVLRRFRDTTRFGGRFSEITGLPVQQFPVENVRQAFGMGDGVIWAIDTAGQLWSVWDNRHPNPTAPKAGLQGLRRLDIGWDRLSMAAARPSEGGVMALDVPERVAGPSALYGVEPKGSPNAGQMRYYTYQRPIPDGWTKTGQEMNVGWNRFKQIIGCSDLILGVQDDGGLYWYRYATKRDPGWGSHGQFEFLPNSANCIGIGWGDFQVITGAYSGKHSPKPNDRYIYDIYVVDRAGDLARYGYSGEGELDAQAVKGVLPISECS